MTQLTDVRKIKTVALPSYPDVTVEIYDSLLTGQVSDIRVHDGNDLDTGIAALQLLIKSWSFVDEQEKPLPVTLDNLKKLPTTDFSALMDAVGDIMNTEEAKKKKN